MTRPRYLCPFTASTMTSAEGGAARTVTTLMPFSVPVTTSPDALRPEPSPMLTRTMYRRSPRTRSRRSCPARGAGIVRLVTMTARMTLMMRFRRYELLTDGDVKRNLHGYLREHDRGDSVSGSDRRTVVRWLPFHRVQEFLSWSPFHHPGLAREDLSF